MTLNGVPGNTGRKNGMQASNGKMHATIYHIAIIRVAVQARDRLSNPNPDPEEVRRDLRLLQIGQDLLGRLQAAGVNLPEIDLTDPPPAAAAPSDVDHREFSRADHRV
jgi:hypothetical protein